MLKAVTAIVDFYEDTGKDEVSKRARKEIQAAKKLKKYIHHERGCLSFLTERDAQGRFAKYSCTCGLDKILSVFKKEK